MAASKPTPPNIHAIGFCGLLRATIAPTTEKTTAKISSKPRKAHAFFGKGADRPITKSTTPIPVTASVVTRTTVANLVTVRDFIGVSEAALGRAWAKRGGDIATGSRLHSPLSS